MAQPFFRGGNKPRPAPFVRAVAAALPVDPDDVPARDRNSPDSASSSSSCPLPATPAMPSTSPLLHGKADVLQRSAERNGRGAPKAPSPPAPRRPWSPAFGPGSSTAPTISLGHLARRSGRAGCRCATTLPRRRIVASSHRARISSSLWLIYRIAVPSADSWRSVLNRISTSCGVRTAGRFVHDQQLRVLQQAADDLHPLPFARRQVAHHPRRVQRQAIVLATPRGSAPPVRRIGGGFSMPRATFSATFSASNRLKC